MTHTSTRDLSVELPTGTGKTLPGLLIADWRRRTKQGRAVFACPTVQLVGQVVRAAADEGIPAVDLSGGWRSWSSADEQKYHSARAIAVVTYSTVFNIHPHLVQPDVIVFDDAHAADQYVISAYTVSIGRHDLPSVYEDVIEALRPHMPKERHGQLVMQAPGPSARSSIDVHFPALADDAVQALDHALVKLEGLPGAAATEQAFRYSAIRGHLSACNVYTTWDRIEIRPTIAPTFENGVFSNANQRVYLSATLGAAGELQRAFSRPSITPLRLPAQAAKPRSGRRFIVFPHLVPGADPDDLTRQIFQLAERAIVLTPSERGVTHATAAIVPLGWSVLGKAAVATSPTPFSAAQDAVCILANRYDGIDLPGDACRIVALYGLPRATNLTEEFLSTRARATAALDERIRSRVVQGTGRCTRGPRDWAVVVVADTETTTYLSRPEVQASLDEDLQAEVRFGLEQSEGDAADLLDNITMFLAREEAWQRDAEPLIAEYRSESHVQPPAAAAGLLASAPLEVRAAEASWNNDWSTAGERSHQAAEALSSYPDARGYRAFQLFLSSVCFNTAGRNANDQRLLATANAAADAATAAATPATWMRSSLPLPGATPRGLAPADRVAVEALTDLLAEVGSSTKHNAAVAAMQAGLAAVDHWQYEPALSTLGRLLGADASKPKGDGRADSVWCWGDFLWVTLEAKSEHLSAGQIGLDDIRQVNSHLTFLASDRGADVPDDSASVIISPREVFKRDAALIAETFTFKVTPADITALGSSVERLWLSLWTLRNISDRTARAESVQAILRDARMLPTDIFDRLTSQPIHRR